MHYPTSKLVHTLIPVLGSTAWEHVQFHGRANGFTAST